MRRDYIEIKQGESRFFPKNTVLDITMYKEIPRKYLETLCKREQAKILGIIEDEILKDIDRIIKNAYTLSPKIIEKII